MHQVNIVHPGRYLLDASLADREEETQVTGQYFHFKEVKTNFNQSYKTNN